MCIKRRNGKERYTTSAPKVFNIFKSTQLSLSLSISILS